MLFEKNGVRFEVTDKAHIDCFKAKGWKAVEKKVNEPTIEEKPQKRGRKTKE